MSLLQKAKDETFADDGLFFPPVPLHCTVLLTHAGDGCRRLEAGPRFRSGDGVLRKLYNKKYATLFLFFWKGRE